jgi:hypothetical protein
LKVCQHAGRDGREVRGEEEEGRWEGGREGLECNEGVGWDGR